MYFYAEERVKYYDCDCNNQLKISAAMKMMQQTSSEQLEQLGFSVEKLFAEDMVFLLSKMCVKVHRMPVSSERVYVGTAPVTPRGARFVREFVIESPNRERLVSAFSLWILVNPATRKILRPASFPYALQFQESHLEQIIDDVAFPKALETRGEVREISIGYSHLDVNCHVNNTIYADFICDCLPFPLLRDQGLDSMVIHFQNEAKWGDQLQITTHPQSSEEFYLTGYHGTGPCFEALVYLNKTQ